TAWSGEPKVWIVRTPDIGLTKLAAAGMKDRFSSAVQLKASVDRHTASASVGAEAFPVWARPGQLSDFVE
ncbi:hypothetical protein R5H32_20145, partial [Defluviimonas sp. D31]|uniref:hypothetical protein n=1 Tax=Defluviimonas sp. D31 TaxID=3083253 RepID=UPI00296FC2C7